jgi:hypothetical protein
MDIDGRASGLTAADRRPDAETGLALDAARDWDSAETVTTSGGRAAQAE